MNLTGRLSGNRRSDLLGQTGLEQGLSTGQLTTIDRLQLNPPTGPALQPGQWNTLGN